MIVIRHGVSEEVFSWTLAASPLDVNAYRIRQFNSIVLPFGLLTSTLQGSNGVPSYINRGALGFIIAHEIMHSVDNSGRGFDLQGKLAQVWDQSSLIRLSFLRMNLSLRLIFFADMKKERNA